MSGDHNQYQKGTSYLDLSKDGKEIELVVSHDFECPRCGHCCANEYERGFVDGMQRQMQSSVDKALNEKREPLYWSVSTGWVYANDTSQVGTSKEVNWTPIYTEPPKREWVGLTDQEVWEAIENVLEGGGWLDVARTLEQAIKEKNT